MATKRLNPQDALAQLYQSYAGQPCDRIEPLAGSGSHRRYYRLYSQDAATDTLIGVAGTQVEENDSFCAIARHMQAKGLNAPRVCAVSDDRMTYLQQDLGDTSLYDFVKDGRKSGIYTDEHRKALTSAMTLLADVQFGCDDKSVYTHCYQGPAMDEMSVMFDLNYFKYCFVKLRGIELDEPALERDFRALTADLLHGGQWAFMVRDFQARNVMLHNGKPYVIDFQGGRRGPIYYDVASFVYQASANYDKSLKEHLILAYITAASRHTNINIAEFVERLRLFVFFRTLQVLGAYGFRGLWERKQYFIDSIPAALDNLRQSLLNGTIDDYPYLRGLCHRLCIQPSIDNTETAHGLTVDVYSFSYKNGIPTDSSGNGGGYVFDCRSTHNPGRYDDYKALTGLDQPVIDFLEHDGEITAFLTNVFRLADFHVQRYRERQFTHLQFAFGCTGGRHRSVYSAQHLAEHLHEQFPDITIRLYHRERGISQTFTPAQP